MNLPVVGVFGSCTTTVGRFSISEKNVHSLFIPMSIHGVMAFFKKKKTSVVLV